MIRACLISVVVLTVALQSARALPEENAPPNTGSPADTVSYYRDILPVLQAHCHGCHQPAKQSGQYDMTEFERLVQGGESEESAIVAGDPDASYLVGQIVPTDGKAEMPKGKPALSKTQIDLIQKWIVQGAGNDTPASVRPRYDQDHPPKYSAPSVITSLDFSPDGQLLAISGYHEVLLHKVDGSGLVARLVGMSERIESAVFSPDGRRVAVTGGSPGRMGEVQVWQVEPPQLQLSLPVTHDTVYGASWSPDGNFVAFGCVDQTVRVINASTGEQVLYNGAHNDWVLDTTFSQKGTHVISVSRDRSMKLIDLQTQRFIDNITSITPGLLKGGMHAVARHPERDELVVGGADGIPKVFRMVRLTARKIGDDANLIRRLPKMPGRVFAVSVSPNGRRIAAGSSHDGQGAVFVYGYEFNTAMSDEIKGIVAKSFKDRTETDKARLNEHHSEGVRVIAQMEGQQGAAYAVDFSSDSQLIASGGFDGVVRLNETETGKLVKEFLPVEIEANDAASAKP